MIGFTLGVELVTPDGESRWATALVSFEPNDVTPGSREVDIRLEDGADSVSVLLDLDDALAVLEHISEQRALKTAETESLETVDA